MLPQQIIALIIIVFLIYKLIKQKQKKQIGLNEFVLWLSLWSIAAIAILFIKQLDSLLNHWGIASSAINFLIYLSVLILFYFVFKMRLNIAKLDRSITELNKIVTLKNHQENTNRK